MNAFLRLWQWYVEHPAELLLHLAALLSLCWIVGAVVFAVWQGRIEARDRKKFERILQAGTTQPPRAPGFNSRRVS